jgi:enamine deaminase RidA (YjgF/YER057c/UK114 family)
MLDANSKAPETWERQVGQCLENVKAIVEGAGLSMKQVVATQVYVTDLGKWPAASKVYAEYFPSDPPAMTLLEVNKMPAGTLVEINAVAVRDASSRKVIQKGDGPYSNALMAGGRLFVSAMGGEDPKQGDAKLQAVLKAAGMKRSDVVLSTRYSVGGAEAGQVPVQALPGGAKAAIAAVAVKGGGKTKEDCVAADGGLYCVVQSSSGDEIEAAVKATMERLKTRLGASGFSAENVVASNVYLNNLDHFKAMNGIYGSVFSSDPPTRTTVQPLAPGPGALFRVAVAAEK